MKITGIERRRGAKGRHSIFVDGRYAFSVSEETLLREGIRAGDDADEKTLDGIRFRDELAGAMETAWRLLAARQTSRKELVDKLRGKRLSPESAEEAVRKIEELGYLDDRRFAFDRAAALRGRGKGPELIKAELRAAGIDRETITDAMKGRDDGSEETIRAAAELAVKKMKSVKGLPPRAAAERVTGFLARRGFSFETIRGALKAARRELSEPGSDEDI